LIFGNRAVNDPTDGHTSEKEWVSLTQEEILAIGRELGLKCRLGGNPSIDFDYYYVIDEKLREKNT